MEVKVTAPDPNRIGTLPRQLLEQRDARIRDLEKFLKASQDGQAHYQERLQDALTVIEGQRQEIGQMLKRLTELEAEEERRDSVSDALHRVRSWCRAYPIAVFPEPPWNRVRHTLEAGGLSLDQVSASNMRHVCDGIARIIDEALK